MRKTAKILAVFAVVWCSASAYGSMQDKLARFSTPGPDRYSDGSVVRDGECYALVWSPEGMVFSGFNADGTPVSSNDHVVLAGALAQGGRCPDAIFQIPAKDYEELKDGEWAVCLVDTRMMNGIPAGVRDGKPVRVNRWGAVKGGVKIEPKDASKLQLAPSGGNLRLASAPAGGTSSSSSDEGSGATALPVRARTLSAVPPTVQPPQITAIEIADGEVWLGVTDTVPYLSYTIISGEKPNALKTDYFSEVVDGEANAEIAIGTVKSVKRRFFKVKRAE